jgi:hypothetical protein
MNQNIYEVHYNNSKGADWPSYDDFINENYTVNSAINLELQKFREATNHTFKLQKIYNELGKDICLFPFFGVFYPVSSNTLLTCCVSNSPSSIKDNSLLATFNNQKWKDLRKHFLSGSCHDISECSMCSSSEKQNNTSVRKTNNQYYAEHLNIDINTNINNIVQNNYAANQIYSLDVMPSNFCDFECIMCNGQASTKRALFEQKYKKEKKIISIKHDRSGDFFKVLDKIQILNLTGGETLLQPEVHTYIDYLIDNNLAKNVSLHLLTNASSYPTKLLDKFVHFKKINLTVSLDGIEEIIEYQRRGANWNKIKVNSEMLIRNFDASINCVLTAVNIFRIDKLLDYCYSNNYLNIHLSLVKQDFLRPNIIPYILKKEIEKKLVTKKEFLSANTAKGMIYIDLYDQAISSLQGDCSIHLEKFIDYIKYEDLASKKKLHEILPEWKSYIE